MPVREMIDQPGKQQPGLPKCLRRRRQAVRRGSPAAQNSNVGRLREMPLAWVCLWWKGEDQSQVSPEWSGCQPGQPPVALLSVCHPLGREGARTPLGASLGAPGMLRGC